MSTLKYNLINKFWWLILAAMCIFALPYVIREYRRIRAAEERWTR